MQAIAFNVLQLSGLILSIFFIVLAVLLPHVKRLSTWYLILAAEGLYCGSMLLIVGNQEPDGKPPFNICFIQSALIYAAPAGLVMAGLAFTVQLYLSVKFATTQRPMRVSRDSWLLLGVPSLLTSVVFIIILFIGLTNPSNVELSKTTLYCHIASRFPSQFIGVIVCISSVAAVVTQGMTLSLIHGCHHKFAFLRRSTGGIVSWTTLFRVLVIDIIAISGIVVGITQSVLKAYTSSAIILYTAAIHVIGIVVIGFSTLQIIGDTLDEASQLENGNTSDKSKYLTPHSPSILQ